ncbi:glycoside hydrolase family 172 protein [Nocardia sp. NPDC048505]|uniref:glycoside hydrolase family 172 protein n=1 Tax=Nocardia sp. NPDC048505 TaxID=3155756 RepID=UPI0033C5B0DF
MNPAGSAPELWRLDAARTRSVSPENPTGAAGGGARASTGTGAHAARLLGPGWKVSPSIELAPGATAVLADIAGPGVIRHFWLTTDRAVLRRLTLQVRWDDDPRPAIDLSLGHFFCNGWEELALFGSEMMVVAPAGGLNSYWPMPFHSRARLTLHNGSDRAVPVYYQVTYTEEDLPGDAARLHTRWRRSAPLGTPAIHTILDGVEGPGRYVGTYLAIQPGAPGWWGEGELKFYLDGDDEHPTLCGTGTEDYFGGAWNFDLAGTYRTYTSPYLGLHQVLPPEEIYRPHQRFGMYRWHVRDPICFRTGLRVTLQALGWGDSETYLPLEHADIATTAWYYA